MVGATAAAYTKCVFPADVIHLNLVGPSYSSAEPGATHNAFWAIGKGMVRTEGVLSLTGGFGASMIREFVYSGMRIGTYEFFKDK